MIIESNYQKCGRDKEREREWEKRNVHTFRNIGGISAIAKSIDDNID